jgi:hypothetical protein
VRKELYFDLVILSILALAGLAYSIAWKSAPVIVPDSADYIQVAQDLQDGQLGRLHGRTPGYPVLLLRTNSIGDEPSRALFAALFLLPLAIITYTSLTSTMFEVGNPRYRTPTDLLIFYTLVLGIHFFAQVRKRVTSEPDSAQEEVG